MTRKVSKQISSFFDVPTGKWPADIKRRLKGIADDVWAEAVKKDWNYCCAVCGNRKTESHHLIPRKNQYYRHQIRNGVALCYTHHQVCPHQSPHQNAAGWLQWMQKHQPLLYEWYIRSNERRDRVVVVDVDYYLDKIHHLEQYIPDEFAGIVGVRLAVWLEERYA